MVGVGRVGVDGAFWAAPVEAESSESDRPPSMRREAAALTSAERARARAARAAGKPISTSCRTSPE